MKNALRELHAEHEHVATAARMLLRVADRAALGEPFDAASALELLDFFTVTANVYHQRKEEEGLFPALFEQGLARARVAQLLEDHLHEREEMTELGALLEGAAYGDGGSLDRFVCVAQRFARHQLAHAAWEEEILLPLAEELLDAAHEARVLAAFRRIDAEAGPRSVEARAEGLARIAARVEETEQAACTVP